MDHYNVLGEKVLALMKSMMSPCSLIPQELIQYSLYYLFYFLSLCLSCSLYLQCHAFHSQDLISFTAQITLENHCFQLTFSGQGSGSKSIHIPALNELDSSNFPFQAKL